MTNMTTTKALSVLLGVQELDELDRLRSENQALNDKVQTLTRKQKFTGYQLFSRSMREFVVNNLMTNSKEPVKARTIIMETVAMWNNLSNEEKQKWNDK